MAKDKRDNRIPVALSDDEKSIGSDAAKKTGSTIAGFMRTAMLEKAGKVLAGERTND